MRSPTGSANRPSCAPGPACSPGAPDPPAPPTATTSFPTTRAAATCSCNLAALCRRHHRLKTHTTWSYTILEPGSFLWSSPHGYQFLTDHQGTRDVTASAPATRTTAPTCLADPPDQ